MAKRLTQVQIDKIMKMRSEGSSLPEIYNEIHVGYGTIYRYAKNVPIQSEYISAWKIKRGGSQKRMQKALLEAAIKAKHTVQSISDTDKLIFLSSLYWAEGSKHDFSLSNTDPKLIKVFVNGLVEILEVPKDNLKISIRIYEDLNKEKCLNYWSKIVGIPVSQFINVNVIKGKKKGKLEFGMCRVRIAKGGNLLKYLTAVRNQVCSFF